MHPNIPPEIVLRHLGEQAARDRRIPAPRQPVRRVRFSTVVLRPGRREAR